MSHPSTSTNPTTNKPATTLVLTAGGRGGSGKTTALSLVADYVATLARTSAIVDCDLENAGSPASFAHWFGGKASQLDLRDVEACDQLLRQAATSGAEYVLADLPANSSGDLVDWLENVATPELIRALGIRLVTVCAVNPEAGAAESATRWMSTLGERSNYLVVLNRTGFERRPKPLDATFEAWFHWIKGHPPTVPFATVEIPHLHKPTMEQLLALQKLPSAAVKDPQMDPFLRIRIQGWAKKAHEQLATTCLFSPATPATKQVPAAA